MRFKPVAQPLWIITLAYPLRDCDTARIFLRESEEWLQPALMLLGKVEVRKAGELGLRLVTRGPAATMDEIESGRKTRTILATGTFDQEWPGSAVESVE